MPRVKEVEEEETTGEPKKEVFIDLVRKSAKSKGKDPEILMKRISINLEKNNRKNAKNQSA